jgi:hypothetical protein
MKAAFNDHFGLSVVLAPDYTYLSGSDPKLMEPYVDFFDFMATTSTDLGTRIFLLSVGYPYRY